MSITYRKYIFYIPFILLLLVTLIFVFFKKQYSGFETYASADSIPILIVTAYYPVRTKRHTKENYIELIKLFFKNVSCPVVCFCPKSMHKLFSEISGPNVKLIIREFTSFQMMSKQQMIVWNDFYKKDPEKNRHSPDLYAVWGAKQEFVREAIKIQKSEIYVWCDIGAIRKEGHASFLNTSRFVVPNKITCLDIENIIGGGVLAGDKDAWALFSNNYLKELKQNPHGNDQIIYKRIVNEDNSIIIKPTTEYGDPWFYLIYLFSN